MENFRKIIFLFCLISYLSYFFLYDEISQSLSKNEALFKEDHSEFRLNPEWSICGQRPQTKTYLFIVFVVVAPHQFEQRNHIRNTWANQTLFSTDMKVIFTVALSKNQTVNNLLFNEFKLYRDVLQIENLTDSYYNCTIKIMKTYKWIGKYCSNTQYMIKICDDVVVNTPQLIRNFKNVIPYKTNHMFGYVFYGNVPIRDRGSKWYISEKEFNGTKFDPYPDGTIFYFMFI